MDHRAFQRLRYIKQLGLAEYVFPCATHTRFQHSLGASYLAVQYYETMVRGWSHSTFDFEGKVEKTQFFASSTQKKMAEVADHPESYRFWLQTIGLAGLLHDVGHGPWSHTFEYLELDQDFSGVLRSIEGAIGKYLRELLEKKKTLMHEEISILYIYKILQDLENSGAVSDALRFFVPVSTLVHRKMGLGKFQKEFEKEIESVLDKRGIKGGVEVHRLLRPVISGPFDVDRIDYIQRDGRNCGVNIGGIEWRRIVSKLIPCLANHQGSSNEPKDVVLISNVKNQHVLDDFIFSLFQMYAQVYLHPKIVGVEEVARRLLKKMGKLKKAPVITFEKHQELTDERFREMLKKEFGLSAIEDMLFRKPEAAVHVVSLPHNAGIEKDLKKNGYFMVDTLDRPMMKDSVGLFLFGSYKHRTGTSTQNEHLVQPWVKVSPIAHHFYSINYSPKIWLQSDLTP
ncbi:MAG: HD domain-containing protein [Proteobacteria bacterium]|nr:HD domain-containing protein [Pseudomonadota bacterium]